MASHTRVLNVSTGKSIKRSQARGRIEQCLSDWVQGQRGFQIYDLTASERIARRAGQSREELRQRALGENPVGKLPMAEVPGRRFVLPQQPGAVRDAQRLAWQAGMTVKAIRGEFSWIDPAATYAESCA